MFRAGSCNAHGPARAGRNKATVNKMAPLVDIIGWQEVDGDVWSAISARREFMSHRPAGVAASNAISWRPGKFKLNDKGSHIIMRNKPNVKDGPDRSLCWANLDVLVEQDALGGPRDLNFVSTHLIHQAFTSHKERQRAWYASLAEAARFIQGLRMAYPMSATVLVGDFNNPGDIDLLNLMERELPSPGTYDGWRRYDRMYIIDALRGGAARDIPTESDHDGLVAELAFVTNRITRGRDFMYRGIQEMAGDWDKRPRVRRDRNTIANVLAGMARS